VVLQRHGPPHLDDDVEGRGPDLRHPRREVVDVRNRGGEADHPDVLRGVDDRLLPDRAALDVVDVVDLVVDHRADVLEASRILEDRVPEHLRGHDQQARARVDGHVAGHDADGVAVDLPEVAELLVAERLDGRRVDDALVPLERVLDGEVRDEGLPRAGGRRDEHGVALQDRADRLHLKGVELEAPEGPRTGALGTGGSVGRSGCAHGFSGTDGVPLGKERPGLRRGGREPFPPCPPVLLA
jgi:hypothetical protein